MCATGVAKEKLPFTFPKTFLKCRAHSSKSRAFQYLLRSKELCSEDRYFRLTEITIYLPEAVWLTWNPDMECGLTFHQPKQI